jgi:hypothetical protein
MKVPLQDLHDLLCKNKLNIKKEDSYKENSDADSDDKYIEFMNKLDNQTLQLCKPLFNSACTVNMENYYMSTTCAMKFLQNNNPLKL